MSRFTRRSVRRLTSAQLADLVRVCVRRGLYRVLSVIDEERYHRESDVHEDTPSLDAPWWETSR